MKASALSGVPIKHPSAAQVENAPKYLQITYVFHNTGHWTKPSTLAADEQGNWFLGNADWNDNILPAKGCQPVKIQDALRCYAVCNSFAEGGTGLIETLLNAAALRIEALEQ